MIFDTDILVWFLRKHPGAAGFIEKVPLADRNISAISYLELLYGCRDQLELHRLSRHIADKFVQVLPLSEAITASAAQLMERFALSRRPGVNDVLIAATAVSRGEAVATAKRKHFDFVPGLDIKLFRP